MKEIANYVASWPEERTVERLERCRSMLVAAGLIGEKINNTISRRIKQAAGVSVKRRVRT